eukprot:g7953.t1
MPRIPPSKSAFAFNADNNVSASTTAIANRDVHIGINANHGGCAANTNRDFCTCISAHDVCCTGTTAYHDVSTGINAKHDVRTGNTHGEVPKSRVEWHGALPKAMGSCSCCY